MVGTNREGQPILQRKVRRPKLLAVVAQLASDLTAMEACPGTQHLARRMQELGLSVKLIAPQFAKPYVKSQKNDFNDAEAIAGAARRPTMRFVPVKSAEQLDLQALHRYRERLVHDRTAIINQIRAFLLENDLTVDKGRPALRRDLPDILEDGENALSESMRSILARLENRWELVEEMVEEANRQIKSIAANRDDCRRLLTIPGIGLVVGAQVGETSILTRAALTVMNQYRSAIVAAEGAFGTLLLERDLTEPCLMFSRGGKLTVERERNFQSPGLGLTIRGELLVAA